jgi:hypothetical protein
VLVPYLGHPDHWLSLCDFFLWGYVKDHVYQTLVANIH